MVTKDNNIKHISVIMNLVDNGNEELQCDIVFHLPTVSP